MCNKKIFNYIVIIGILSFIVLTTTLSSSINADDYVDPTIFGGGVSNSSSSTSTSSTFNSGNTDIDIIMNSLYGSSSSTSSSSSSGSLSNGFCKVKMGTERYCVDCGPCDEGQGTCFSNSDCKPGLVCNSIGVCARTPYSGCRLPEGYEGYCDPHVCGPCREGQSRCNKKDDCIGDLVCSANGYCVRSSGGPSGCGIPPIPRERYCRVGGCGPCKEGEGWCENNSECVSGLICDSRTNLCVRSSNQSSGSGGCRVSSPSEGYCSPLGCGPCKENEGWCKDNSECVSGLVCRNSFCVRPSNQPSGSGDCRIQEGTLTYCAACGPCSEGQSVCHEDSQCVSGLVCSYNGFCVRPSYSGGCKTNQGSERYCADCGPCEEGQGMCFNDNHCDAGLVCINHTCVRSNDSGGGTSSSGTCKSKPGSARYCMDCGPCEEGQRMCFNNSQCKSGLICSNYTCIEIKRVSTTDGCRLTPPNETYCDPQVCGPCKEGEGWCMNGNECALGLICSGSFCVYPSIPLDSFFNNDDNICQVPVGSATYCTDCGPCREGQGKCSKDTDCIKGLVCSEHTGVCKKP